MGFTQAYPMMYKDESWQEVHHLWCMMCIQCRVHVLPVIFQCIPCLRYDSSYLAYVLGVICNMVGDNQIMTSIFAAISCNIFILLTAQGVCKYPTESFTVDCSWLQVRRLHLWTSFNNTGKLAYQHCYTDCSTNHPSTHKGSAKTLWETLYEGKTNC